MRQSFGGGVSGELIAFELHHPLIGGEPAAAGTVLVHRPHAAVQPPVVVIFPESVEIQVHDPAARPDQRRPELSS